MALTAEPATFPYVLALRWLTADGEAPDPKRSRKKAKPEGQSDLF